MGRVTAGSFLVSNPEGTHPVRQTADVTRIDVEPAKAKGEDDSVRHRDVTELLKLIQLLLETWGNVIKICRVFGVCSWEGAFIT